MADSSGQVTSEQLGVFSQKMQLGDIQMLSRDARREERTSVRVAPSKCPCKSQVPCFHTTKLHDQVSVELASVSSMWRKSFAGSFGCTIVRSNVQAIATTHPCSVRCAHRIFSPSIGIALGKSILSQVTLQLLYEDLVSAF